MHHASFTSPDFQASYREEPLAFCLGCHAPRAPAAGVGCESCHPHAGAHALDRAVAATTTPCAPCHDFPSPIANTAFLQTTEQEHRVGRHRDVACVDCHMVRGPAGERDHGFSVSRNLALLSRAIEVAPPRVDARGITVTLSAVGVGHRFPTGDIFRQLLVRSWVEDEAGRILAEREVALHRDWRAQREGRPERDDTRLGDEPFEVALPPVGRSARRVLVQVHYQRGFEARGGDLSLFSSDAILRRELAL